MMHRAAITRRLRQGRGGWLIALFAMLLQIVFAAEHASALAVAVAKGGPDGQPMGFLDICTAQGLLRLPAGEGEGASIPAPLSHNGASCAVCATAAATGAADMPEAAPVATIPTLLQVAPVLPLVRHVVRPDAAHDHAPRAPPSC